MGSTAARILLSVMSVEWPAARRGHASHSDPSATMLWARRGTAPASEPMSRKNATTTSALADDKRFTTLTPSGRSTISHLGGTPTRQSRWKGFNPSLRARGVPE
jgi:hypothetical protein